MGAGRQNIDTGPAPGAPLSLGKRFLRGGRDLRPFPCSRARSPGRRRRSARRHAPHRLRCGHGLGRPSGARRSRRKGGLRRADAPGIPRPGHRSGQFPAGGHEALPEPAPLPGWPRGDALRAAHEAHPRRARVRRLPKAIPWDRPRIRRLASTVHSSTPRRSTGRSSRRSSSARPSSSRASSRGASFPTAGVTCASEDDVDGPTSSSSRERSRSPTRSSSSTSRPRSSRTAPRASRSSVPGSATPPWSRR
jgi:hypothetical protein